MARLRSRISLRYANSERTLLPLANALTQEAFALQSMPSTGMLLLILLFVSES